jgi:hypothetical protein
MASMSRLFILLLIALLPLRGWTAQGMAMQMGAMDRGAMDRGGVAVAAQMPGADEGMAPDCPLYMQMASTPAATDASGTPAHKGCQSCQLCMPLVAMDAPTSVALGAHPQALPVSRWQSFASADRARHVKPPIS